MFEVGKEYKNKNEPWHKYMCLAVDDCQAWLKKNDGYKGTITFSDVWIEVKEPRSITGWMNVYDAEGGLQFGVRCDSEEEAKGAISMSHKLKYLATVSVTYTEEVYV